MIMENRLMLIMLKIISQKSMKNNSPKVSEMQIVLKQTKIKDTNQIVSSNINNPNRNSTLRSVLSAKDEDEDDEEEEVKFKFRS